MRPLPVLLLLLISSPVAAQTVVGEARVIDGDTLAIGETTIRLFGIDAPEADQTCQRDGITWPCGEESARQLGELIGQTQVTCQTQEMDQYGRNVAVCFAGSFALNATIVEYGWATAYRQFSSNFVAHETRARASRQGIWNSEFLLPEQYRLSQQDSTENEAWRERTAAPRSPRNSSDGCVIKGNHSRRGDWIYHLPGMQYYEQTRPEAMFCSEAEALAAGYRRSRV